MWAWITSSRTNKILAGAIAILLVLALTSAVGAWHFRGRMNAAKEAEKAARQDMKDLQREGEIQKEAYQKAIGATEPALRSAIAGVREAKATLARAEEARRGIWTPPAVDNGDLVARFERALEAIR
jgi:uncharacterized protein HemX